MAFTIGSGTFTNGSATVTGVTLTSGTLAYFASGTRMVVGVNPVIQEVEAIAAPTVSTITLRSAWTGTGGTYSFLANQTSEGLRDAVQAIRTNNASLQSFIDSIDTAATADSVAQRTSDGSINAVNVYASGNVGIGTASPSALGKVINVEGGGGGASLALDGGDNFGVIYTGPTADDPTALISNTGFKFATATAKDATGFSEKARLTTDGYLRMGTGTGGIQFNGDTSASNALDDYEEGTWTPTLVGATSGSIPIASTNSARYTKVGNAVHVQCYLNSVTINSSTISGAVLLGGLPFTAGSEFSVVSISHTNMFTVDELTTSVSGYVNSGDSTVVLTKGSSPASFTGADIDSGFAAVLMFSATYRTA